MSQTGRTDVERIIARCRIILSVAAFIAIYIDPLTGGPFKLEPNALAVMVAHLAYSVAFYLFADGRLLTSNRLAVISTWADVLFGAAIALATEGANSPYYVFFAFAVLAAAFRAGMRLTLIVTVTSVALYLGLLLASRPEGLGRYIMRPAYLAIIGYLVGYLGEQRLRLQSRLRNVERELIARSLHDEYVQALSAVNVRLATCRSMLLQQRNEEALGELTELQTGVNREHDDLRSYIRSLVDRETASAPGSLDYRTRFSVSARFEGSLPLLEHALRIVLEGARNIGRHARADSARIEVQANADRVLITIDDDGVGFPVGVAPPWSIASRAAELGGSVRVACRDRPGGHVEIELPGS